LRFRRGRIKEAERINRWKSGLKKGDKERGGLEKTFEEGK
jgi:hypothetical protein